MANDEMHVIVMASNKGGCGKTMMAKAFGSAALGGDYAVHFIDADVNSNLNRWYETALELGNWPEHGKCSPVIDPIGISALVDDLYRQGSTDLVIIDTEGVGSETLEQICLLADTIVTPIKCTKDDYETTLRFKTWYDSFVERVNGDIPSQIYVITDVAMNNPEKLPAIPKEYYGKIRATYATAETVLRHSAIFHRMDAEGPLYTLTQKTADEEVATQRITLGAATKALSNATQVLNDVISENVFEEQLEAKNGA